MALKCQQEIRWVALSLFWTAASRAGTGRYKPASHLSLGLMLFCSSFKALQDLGNYSAFFVFTGEARKHLYHLFLLSRLFLFCRLHPGQRDLIHKLVCFLNCATSSCLTALEMRKRLTELNKGFHPRLVFSGKATFHFSYFVAKIPPQSHSTTANVQRTSTCSVPKGAVALHLPNSSLTILETEAEQVLGTLG